MSSNIKNTAIKFEKDFGSTDLLKVIVSVIAKVLVENNVVKEKQLESEFTNIIKGWKAPKRPKYNKITKSNFVSFECVKCGNCWPEALPKGVTKKQIDDRKCVCGGKTTHF